jgi:MarR family transcriptional regulator, organic hydroperoxide resistance regulator
MAAMKSTEHDPAYPPTRGLFSWLQLVRTYNHIEARISADLRADDLTLARVHVMAMLDRVGPMSQQALADRLFVTKGNVVGLINKLSTRGLVERSASKTDRRSNLLRITPAGRAVIERIMPRQHALIGQLMAPLNDAEIGMLEKMLTRLNGVHLEVVASNRA